MKNNVVVFGGSGFLGSYVIAVFLKAGYQVVNADLHYSGHAPEECFMYCDILDKTSVDKIMLEAKPDLILNFAGYSNLDDAMNEPYMVINLNVLGNLNILESMREKNVKRYIYASSAYAMNNKASFYGISKLASEKIVEEYHQKYDINSTILRFGSVYSELNYSNNYLYSIVKNAVLFHRIDHSGDGEEVREYIHAQDAAQLTLEIVENDKYVGENILLTGVERLKRKEIFQMISEILNEAIEINITGGGYNHHYKYTPFQFQASHGKKLVANPYIDLGQGLLQCIQSVKATIKND